MTQAAVKVDRLEKTLGSNKVLRGITFEAHSGEIFGLLGPNGAGKTTTLRVICTLLAPDSGSVEVLGYDTRVSPQEVRRRVGVVTAEIGIYPRLSARENIAYFAELTGDRQWIHVDPQRAKSQSPYGTTIAHGLLTLSFISPVAPTITQASVQTGSRPRSWPRRSTIWRKEMPRLGANCTEASLRGGRQPDVAISSAEQRGRVPLVCARVRRDR